MSSLVILVMAIFFLLLAVLRTVFIILFFVPAVICENYGDVIEKCTNKTIFYDQITQNELDMVGTFLEAFNSTLLFVLLLRWEIFNIFSFFLATLSFGYFWFWLSMLMITIMTASEIDFSKGFITLGVSIIIELLALVCLSSALHRVPKRLFYRWLQQKLRQKCLVSFSYYTFYFVLFVYFARNLSLFLYDLALTAKKIPRQTAPIDSLLLVLNTAMRASFVGFFYSKIHENVVLASVCDNIDTDYDPVMKWMAPSEKLDRLCGPPTVSNAHLL